MKFDCNRYFVFFIVYMIGMLVIGISSLGKLFSAYVFTEQTLATLIIMCIVPFYAGYKSEVELTW